MARFPRLQVLVVFAAVVAVAGCSSDDGKIESAVVIDATSTTAGETGTTSGDAPSTTSGETDTTATTATTEAGQTATTEAAQTATTESAGPATTSAPVGGDDICVPLKVLSEYDIASSELITSSSWEEVQSYFVDSTPAVLDAYDEAIALDTDLVDDLQTLRDLTANTAELAGDSDSLADFGSKLLELPDIMAAGEAALELNSFSVANCGFSTGGN